LAWKLIFSNRSVKDAKNLKRAGMWNNAEKILDVLRDDPFKNPPPFERLVGDLKGAYSRRINIQHRLVYKVLTEERTVCILRMWTHYE
jgi:Txe/YoeB family toxin of toxin-antitoxin system